MYVAWLKDIASIPSISVTGEGIRECAAYLSRLMTGIGIDVELVETGGSPLVVGRVGPGPRRLLVYGHYDVQPIGRLEDWKSPPFSATIRDGAIYGRGVGDNKGQLLAHLCAIDAWRKVRGRCPDVGILFVFDGEEEIGSPATRSFIAQHPERFKADLIFAADGSTLGVWDPALYLAVHGLLYVELTEIGPTKEWHSGSYGKLLPNPALRLAHAIASIVDRQGNVLVGGFYDSVREPTTELQRVIGDLPTAFLKNPEVYGVQQFTTTATREAMFLEPKACLCGLLAGYVGKGVKTAVPTEASAKIDVTLVPDQEPEEIYGLLRAHLDQAGFDGIELTMLAACRPVSIDPEHDFVRMVAEAMEQVWGRKPVLFPSIGGGGPLADLASVTGSPTLMAPYAQADLNEHSVDEHLSIEWFLNGIRTSMSIYRRLLL